MVSGFKVTPLHRRRKGRRKRVAVLNQDELADLLDVPLSELRAALEAAGWRYHEDSTGGLWATPPDQPG